MMLLWLSCRKILISLMAVIGKPSFSLSSRTFFKATISAVKQKNTVSRLHHQLVSPLTDSTVSLQCLTSVFVFSFVHLAVGAFTCDSNYLKLVHTAFAPVYLSFLNLTVSWATNSGK